MESTCVGAVAGLLVLIVINGFALEFSPFTLLMAAVSAINSMAFAFCAFRALDHINLSLFSVFSMLGGMILPFFQGIFFYGEGVTLAKGICVLFIIAALANVEASLQYPMVTGGTMIVSTVISCFGDKKPNKREIASVALAFLGMLALFVIPV